MIGLSNIFNLHKKDKLCFFVLEINFH
jgi:hypothetical protein